MTYITLQLELNHLGRLDESPLFCPQSRFGNGKLLSAGLIEFGRGFAFFFFLQCFDAIGWSTGGAFGLQKL